MDTTPFKRLPHKPDKPYVPQPEYTLTVYEHASRRFHLCVSNWKTNRHHMVGISHFFGTRYAPLKMSAVRVEEHLLIALGTRQTLWRIVVGPNEVVMRELEIVEKPISLTSPQFVDSNGQVFLVVDTGFGSRGERTRLAPIPNAKRKAPDSLGCTKALKVG